MLLLCLNPLATYEMKIFFKCFSIWVVTLVNAVFCMHYEADMKRFIVVSGSAVAIEFYPPPKESRSDEEPNLDGRKQICRDILGSYAFAQNEEYPYEQESIPFLQLLPLLQCHRIHEPKNYNFKVIQSILIGGNRKTVNEYAFVCLAHNGSGHNIKEYYVSSEYNLTFRTDGASSAYFPARFVFHYLSHKHKVLSLRNLAETPAQVYGLPSRQFCNIERLYLDRREAFVPAHSRKLDALCRQQLIDKLRICLAVFNASYFRGKIEYPPSSVGQIEGTCEWRTVSFQKDQGQSSGQTVTRMYNEWVMSCKPVQSEGTFKFLLSNAYRDNEIFVYIWEPTTERMFVDALMTNVRLDTKHWIRRREAGKTDEDYQFKMDEKDEDYLH